MKLQIFINFGVLEYWSVGVMDEGLMSSFNTSNTPALQYSKIGTVRNFLEP